MYIIGLLPTHSVIRGLQPSKTDPHPGTMTIGDNFLRDLSMGFHKKTLNETFSETLIQSSLPSQFGSLGIPSQCVSICPLP